MTKKEKKTLDKIRADMIARGYSELANSPLGVAICDIAIRGASQLKNHIKNQRKGV